MERVSIRDALGGLSGLKRGGVSSLLSQVELIEPTFQASLPCAAPSSYAICLTSDSILLLLQMHQVACPQNQDIVLVSPVFSL